MGGWGDGEKELARSERGEGGREGRDRDRDREETETETETEREQVSWVQLWIFNKATITQPDLNLTAGQAVLVARKQKHTRARTHTQTHTHSRPRDPRGYSQV